MPCGEPDRPVSTDSAVRNAAQDVLDLASAKLRVDGRNRCDSAERTIGTLKPAQGALSITEILIGKGNNASEPVKPIGFVARQPSATASTLQTSRGEIERAGELLEGQSGGTHQFLDHGRAKPLADGFTQIAIAGQVTSQGALTPEFVNDGSQLIYHSVAHDSDKWRTGQLRERPVPSLVSSIKLAFSFLARSRLRSDIHKRIANCGVRLRKSVSDARSE